MATAKALWLRIMAKLDHGPNGAVEQWNWRARIDGLGQLAQSAKRRQNLPFSDTDVFEAMLKAILSNSTDWSRVERFLGDLPELFSDYSLSEFAKRDEDYVDNVLIPRFKLEKAGSMTLRKDLRRLLLTANKLSEWAETNGTADSFFDAAIAAADGDLIGATALLGTPRSDFKIDGMGIPLAAEAMKNLGYEVAKPDRHICRALACWGLVSFRDEKWKIAGATQAPEPNHRELIETMRVMQELASAVSIQPSFLDQAVWLLCAKSGCYATNAELTRMGSKNDTKN